MSAAVSMASIDGSDALTPLDEEDLKAMLAEIGAELPQETALGKWLVDGLIHSGITCILGQPERGKTTLAASLCRALIDGASWLGVPTHFPNSMRILYLSEDNSTACELRKRFTASGHADRVLVGVLSGSLGDMTRLTRRPADVGLIVIDSAYAAVPSEIDQEQAAGFIARIQGVKVPVVVIHHESSSGGDKPAGSQRFKAAYRQTLRIKSVKSVGVSLMRLSISVTGNNTARRNLAVDVDRVSLATSMSELDRLPDAADARQRTKRSTRMDQAAKAYAAGAFARRLGISDCSTPGGYATALVGTDKAPKQDRRSELRVLFGGGSAGVGHRTIRDLIGGEHATDFYEGLAS
jgi:hypothetical protein